MPSSRKKLAGILHNWNVLNGQLMQLSEKDVGWLLSYETMNGKRITFLLRLHSRLNKLRRERERRELARAK